VSRSWRPSAASTSTAYGPTSASPSRPAGDKVILDVRPYRRDEHGNKTDQQRLWQVLTMRQGKIVRIQDYTDRPPPSKRPGCPPARKGPR
jgi:hypothetical protein